MVWVLIFSSFVFAQEPVIYTIEGKKDPRLTAKYIASYVSTSRSQECTKANLSTATRKPSIGTKVYEVSEDNYSIDIPVYLAEDENNCGYRFSRIELVMRRLYDDDLYSLHMILNKVPEARAIYYGHRGGIGDGPGKNKPAKLITDKTYYRIAKETRFMCRTRWYTKGFYEAHSSFYCTMQIADGLKENAFIKVGKYSVVTHPKFGIDEIKSDTLKVDVLVDDEGCFASTGKETLKDHFRELPKPKTFWEKVQERLSQIKKLDTESTIFNN